MDAAPGPVILRLAGDPRDPNRVILTYGPPNGDAETARTLPLHIAVVAEEHLQLGQACPPELVARLAAGDEFQRQYARALGFLAVRPRSEAEVRSRLRRKAVEPDLIDAIVARLHRARYLDDAEFARYWVAERARTSPRGARLIKGELRNKGVHPSLIDEALAVFEEEADAEEAATQERALLIPGPPPSAAESDLLEESREVRAALGLAERKHRSYGSLDPATYRRRMTGFLLRRGYGYDVVARVLKRLAAVPRDAGGDDDDDE
ncbi:MAG TPA: RecX family transcriptional regulator [Chloroflexia bacterium]|nr:RecX family transcriptional regulator [Chloroflexia bacterium]